MNTAVARVTVNVPEELAQRLRELAESEGKTFTQSLKEAIALKLYIADAVADGAKLLLETDPDKPLRELVFR